MSETYAEQLDRVRKLAAMGPKYSMDFNTEDLDAVLSRLEHLETRDMVCSYCGKGSAPGTPEDKQREVVAHVLTCEKRPEAKLAERVEELEDAITEAGLILSAVNEDLCSDEIKRTMRRLGAAMNDPAVLKRQGI